MDARRGAQRLPLKAPEGLIGMNLIDSRIRDVTDCSVVALKNDGVLSINPDPGMPIKPNTELVLIGTADGERNFLKAFES